MPKWLNVCVCVCVCALSESFRLQKSLTNVLILLKMKELESTPAMKRLKGTDETYLQCLFEKLSILI